MTEAGQVWAECLSYISRRVNKQSFFTWLKPTLGIGRDNGHFRIGVPNRFVAEWLNEHYRELIQDALRSVTETDGNFQLIVKPPTTDDQQSFFTGSANAKVSPVPSEAMKIKPKPGRSFSTTSFSDRYIFDNFVVGDSNEFAHAAALAVADAPGKTKYNPLFIYGGVGLGKTHLAQAIGNHIVESDDSRRLIYVTSEKFTNEFINSISTKSVHDFANHYRSSDVLIIEDIQFFTGKESTQEQFFHTFNALHQDGKQLVLTADRPPRDIKGLEERLLSRFGWGLVTDIQPPSLETRVAILQRKSEADGYDLPVEVLTYIADSVTTNIRDLEGCLTRLLAYASLRRKDITVDLAQQILKDSLPRAKRSLTIDDIQKKVADEYNVSVEMLKAKKKTANIALARQVAMYLCRALTDLPLKVIGTGFGGRDHSTVIHAQKSILQMIKKDVNLKLKIDQLINSLYV